MLNGNVTIGRIAGIPIRIHFSWLIILGLLVWSLAAGFLPANFPGWTQQEYLITAVIASLLFFLSVLVHELSHSLVALARGLPVSSITLFVFGGVSQIEEESRSPGGEFLIAVVGPVSSVLIAVICFLLAPFGQQISPQVGAILQYLALVNLLVGVFNMIPGFPLDGGRVLRSIIWGLNGNLVRATRIAALVGKVIAFGMIFLGIFAAFNGDLSGIWLAFIGWFLNNAAGATDEQTRIRALLGDARVREAMRTDVRTVPPALSIESLVEDHIKQTRQRSFPVYGGNRLWGIVTLTDVAQVPLERWSQVRVEEIMTPREKVKSTRSDELVEKALGDLQESGVNQLLVIDGEPDQVVGILSRADLVNFLQVKQLGADV